MMPPCRLSRQPPPPPREPPPPPRSLRRCQWRWAARGVPLRWCDGSMTSTRLPRAIPPSMVSPPPRRALVAPSRHRSCRRGRRERRQRVRCCCCCCGCCRCCCCCCCRCGRREGTAPTVSAAPRYSRRCLAPLRAASGAVVPAWSTAAGQAPWRCDVPSGPRRMVISNNILGDSRPS
jgi:hypothetical protein